MRKSFKILQLSENKNMTSKFMGCNKVIAFNVLYVLGKRKNLKTSLRKRTKCVSSQIIQIKQRDNLQVKTLKIAPGK